MEDVVQIASVKVFHPQSADLTPPGQCMPSNVHHVHQCNSNNSNNTKVSEDSFSAAMPDTSNPIQSEESGVKMTSTPIKILPNTTSTLSNNERASVAQQEWKLEVLTEKNNNNFKRHAISRRADISVIQTKSSVFQKWAAMELDAHRPLAKRQLSAESSLRSCREVKKSTLRREETHGGSTVKTTSSLLQPKLREHSSTTKPSTQQNARVFKRKLRKELFSSSEVFSELDTRTIRTGEKLRSQGVFSIQMITKAITEGTLSELEKVRTIWIWLCQNIEYDVSGYLGLTDKLCEPERVVETGRGVCCGYSSVCLQMCQEAGIPCKEVSGHGKGIGYRQGLSYQNSKSCHMWNVVLLEGHWYLLDACWGAGRVDMDNKVFIKKHDDFYFLTDPEDFINSHCPDEAEWQLLEVPIPLQEFEKRVLRTSGFYRMGLILQHPKYFLLPTENGEASVSIKFPKSVDFTYQISQWSASELVEVSSSSGLLTVTRDTMSLRLMPPASGTYDVMIFARRGNSSGTFTWVCSFLLECSEPKPSEELPENPFMSWGLQRTTESLGVSKCSHGAEPAVLETGTLQLHLQTSRPLMMLCELTHKSLDPSTSKRCLATQIEPDKLTCHVLCPYLGYYRLSVFVRDYERTQDGFQNVGNFVLYCVAGAVNLNELFPSSLSTSCGPGIRTQNAGLSKFSHTGALVSTQQGKCNITFQSQPDLELHGVLFKDQRRRSGHPLSRHIFFTHNGSKVTVSIALPESGVYKLGLYSKTSTNEDFSPLCDFVLRNSCESSLPPFPCTYAAWRKGSVLLEPRQGLLEPLSWVHFRVRVPGARRVSVLAEKLVELQLNRSRVWEGEVFTGANVSQVKLAASVGTTSKDMAIIMCFDVLGQQNEM